MSITRDESGDAALWRRAAAGDHEAFGQLFDRHADAVYGYLFRRTADWSQAEDLTAAVFFQAWRRRGQIVLAHDSALPWAVRCRAAAAAQCPPGRPAVPPGPGPARRGGRQVGGAR
jgi:Sigma-70 region 2